MNRAMNAIMICAVDDVATTIVELPAGDVGRYSVNGQCCEIAIKEIVPKYHNLPSEISRKVGLSTNMARL